MRRTTPDRRGWTTQPKPVIGRRGFSFLILVALLGGLFVSVAPPYAAASDPLEDAYAKQKALQEQIASQKAQIVSLTASQSTLSSKISSTKSRLEQVVANVAGVKSEIIDMTVGIAHAQGTLDELGQRIAQLDEELADVQADEQRKKDDLEAQKAILAQRIRTAYDTDRTSMLETFLSSDDFTDVISEVGYQLDFAGQDKALAEQIVKDQQVLAVIHQTVEETRVATASMHELAAGQKAVLDKQLADLAAAKKKLLQLEEQTRQLLASQKAAYAKMAADKAKLKASLAAAAKAEADLEALIRKLVLEQLQQGGIPSQFSGSLLWPMPGVVTQEFGCTGFWMEPPRGSCDHFHKGIDIANKMYTPIRAAGAGKVIIAGKSPYSTGWLVVIAHSTHLVTWYAHVDNDAHPPAVKAGQVVYAGQVIAFEGMTGNTTGPHLHWAVQLDDNWVNPRLFL